MNQCKKYMKKKTWMQGRNAQPIRKHGCKGEILNPLAYLVGTK